MAGSYSALCSDHYVNLKLGLKLELSQRRETVLGFFERMRRQYPAMSEFRKYADELALETAQDASPHSWLAVRSTSVRAGVVNPPTLGQAYRLHRAALEVSPFFLDVSPLDVGYVEVLYGFDIAAGPKQDGVLGDVLLGQSPLGSMLDIPGSRLVDFQPMLGFVLEDSTEAYIEIKTRTDNTKRGRSDEPISVFLILRRHGPIDVLKDLVGIFDELVVQGEELVESKVLPGLVNPIRQSIVPGL